MLGCLDSGGDGSDVGGPPIIVDSTGDGAAAAGVGTTLREAERGAVIAFLTNAAHTQDADTRPRVI